MISSYILYNSAIPFHSNIHLKILLLSSMNPICITAAAGTDLAGIK